MKIRFHPLTIGLVLLALILPSAHALAGPRSLPPLQEETQTPTLTPIPSVPSPADIINAVNNLRIQHGLNPLVIHGVLMEVAAEQASRDGNTPCDFHLFLNLH
jgi:hypothetical protein